jgi:hypothetical protein
MIADTSVVALTYLLPGGSNRASYLRIPGIVATSALKYAELRNLTGAD